VLWLKLQLRGGWSLYPPGMYDRVAGNSALAAALLALAGFVLAHSFKRKPT
jgi:hypothetical protein